MREMQRREQGLFVAGIQRRHEAVEYSERRAYGSLVRLGLSSVDSYGRSLSGHVYAAQCGSGQRQSTVARKMGT
jgi:hypothetical protein